jgi:ABC-2 type transport system ATP-binding protein
MTSEPVVLVRNVAARYGIREVFRSVDFELHAGRALGVLGPSGAGKTTLLRMLVGLIRPADGEILVDGMAPRRAVTCVPVGYFGGEATLPGAVRAARWGTLGTGSAVMAERRRIRTLARGTRQVLGLRTVLGRQQLRLVVLDEAWEGLDPDASRWLSATIETKRDRGAAVVLSSHRLHDLAGVCDSYLFLVNHGATLLHAQEISPVGTVTAATLTSVFDRLRGGAACFRAVS